MDTSEIWRRDWSALFHPEFSEAFLFGACIEASGADANNVSWT